MEILSKRKQTPQLLKYKHSTSINLVTLSFKLDAHSMSDYFPAIHFFQGVNCRVYMF